MDSLLITQSLKCIDCVHITVERQCAREFLDPTATGHVKRQIVIDQKAGTQPPVQHVLRFYCQGNGYQRVNFETKR
jgi:hypothetical protein